MVCFEFGIGTVIRNGNDCIKRFSPFLVTTLWNRSTAHLYWAKFCLPTTCFMLFLVHSPVSCWCLRTLRLLLALDMLIWHYCQVVLWIWMKLDIRSSSCLSFDWLLICLCGVVTSLSWNIFSVHSKVFYSCLVLCICSLYAVALTHFALFQSKLSVILRFIITLDNFFANQCASCCFSCYRDCDGMYFYNEWSFPPIETCNG